MPFSIAIAVISLVLLGACGRHEEPGMSTGASSLVPAAREVHVRSQHPIEVGVVTSAPANTLLTLAGRVGYGEDQYARIASPVQGRVLEVRTRLGHRANAGDVLLIIDSPDMAQAHSEFVRERSELDHATRSYDLAQNLYTGKALPLKELAHAKNDLIKAHAEFRRATARLRSLNKASVERSTPASEDTNTSHFELRSPLSGSVVERSVTLGQSVSIDSNQILLTVANLDHVQVITDLYERDLAMVDRGQEATVTIDAYPKMTFPAVLTAIGDLVDPMTRTIKVLAWVNNPHHTLKPGMIAQMHVDVGNGTSFLAIPQEAVLVVEGVHYVYVVEAEGRYVTRVVKVSYVPGGLVRVLEGIAAGDRIVTKGAMFLEANEAKGVTSASDVLANPEVAMKPDRGRRVGLLQREPGIVGVRTVGDNINTPVGLREGLREGELSRPGRHRDPEISVVEAHRLRDGR